MKLFAIRTLPRVHIYSTNDLLVLEWSAALRTAGISIDSSNCLTLSILTKKLVVLLQPEVSLSSQIKQFLHDNVECIDSFYIISDKVEWRELSLQFSFHLLSESTHPLEAARIFNHTKKAVTRNYFARYATFFNF